MCVMSIFVAEEIQSVHYLCIHYFHSQSLDPSDEDQKLVEMSDSEEVLKETCPAEYSTVEEKDVREVPL